MSLRKHLRDNHNEVDAGPLNDVLFILLMFFLLVSTLANPNVVKVYWAGRTSVGGWYLITEFVDGESLNEFVRGKRRLRDREAVDVALDLLDALAAFHPDSARLADLDVEGIEHPVRGVFIRAPWVAEHGDAVEVLARVDDHPVAVRQGNLLAVSFHPELAGETRLHELLLRMNGRGGSGGG